MATTINNVSEESITVRDSSSGVYRNNLSSSGPQVKESHNRSSGRRGTKWHLRGIGSRSLLLILVWEFIICCSLGLILHKIQYFHLKVGNQEGHNSVSTWVVHGKTVVGIAAVSTFLFPIVSLLAQVVIGRYKLISYSLKILWIFSVVACIISLLYERKSMAKNAFVIQMLLLLILHCWILGAFGASVVSLGMDQIISGTHTNISAFIQWLGWATFSGLAVSAITASISYNCSNLSESEISMIFSLLSVFLFSVGLILDFCFHHKLVKEPVTVNPVSLIFKVLKYAAKHKHPVQRSAFTYCENEQPTRLDNGKSKYGGPFTTEQVEDVKTFWRILLVILVLSMFALPHFIKLLDLASTMEKYSSESKCIQAVSHAVSAPTSTIMFCIPLYELLIYPCLINRGPSILQSAGIGAAALIVSSVYGIIFETVKKALNNECMFREMGHVLDIVFAIPFNHLLGFTAAVMFKSSIEFVCAQAPYNMNGLLIGLYMTLGALFVIFGELFYLTWGNNILSSYACGVWFYLTTLVLAVVSSVLLGLVIRRYKARERDEITRSQDLVEQVYHKYQEQASQN